LKTFPLNSSLSYPNTGLTRHVIDGPKSWNNHKNRNLESVSKKRKVNYFATMVVLPVGCTTPLSLFFLRYPTMPRETDAAGSVAGVCSGAHRFPGDVAHQLVIGAHRPNV
jgi:hypothetical protein